MMPQWLRVLFPQADAVVEDDEQRVVVEVKVASTNTFVSTGRPIRNVNDASEIVLDHAHVFATNVHVFVHVGTGTNRQTHALSIPLWRFCAQVTKNIKAELEDAQ